jgi:Tfp pilus assembly protein PilF
MGDRKAVADGGSRCVLQVPFYFLLVALTVISLRQAQAQPAAASCTPVIARLVSLQGNVKVQRADSEAWVPVAQLDTALCAGDRLRTDAMSRAGLYVQPETVVRVDQNTVITLNQSTDEIAVEFFAVELAAKAINTQSCGAGYFITRFPKKFKVKTPHMNAAVEGTEFVVESSCDATQLTVLEGRVTLESAATGDRQVVEAGQSLASGEAGSGAITTVVKPEDAVQWVLRYPPISDGSSASQAERLLRAGAVDAALVEINSVLRDKPDDSDALALRAVIQVATNDKRGALESASRSTIAGPSNYRAWLALSYAQQAEFNLEAALASTQRAESFAAESSLAHARAAELLLSLGQPQRAEEAARVAIASNPAESHAHSILGFVHLAQLDTEAARTDFQAAIDRDSFSALPRLGLGLAMIRDGQLVEGRAQIEVSVALDPSNSLLRSYVGKAYYEENSEQRDELAETQFGLAKDLDDSDPTPLFYEAILLQAQNQPVSAIDALHDSIEKNDNRAVYRSRLQLDDDAAARTASLAAFYVELGFEKQAILESTNALAAYPGNYSAHNLLATAYTGLPRHDIARVSEVLQGQIRQPVSHSSTLPVLGADNLAILRAGGPSQLGTSEFNELFSRDGIKFDVDGVVGSRNTFADQFQVSALSGSLSATFSQLHYETDGFVDNDSAEKDLYDLLIQKQFAWNSSIQLDVKRTEFSVEETFFAFDPDNQLPVTIGEDGNLFRVSGHHGVGAESDWIWTAAYEVRDREVQFFPGGFVIAEDDVNAFAGEVQHWNAWDVVQTVSGGGYIETKTSSPLEGVTVKARAANAYVYGNWTSPSERLRVDAGLAADWYRREHSDVARAVSREQLSPKLAVTWTIWAGSTLRLAAFSAVRRPFASSQTIEPTQIAGFNQYFSGLEDLYGDVEGTVSRRAALAFDQSFPRSMNGGVEIAKRKLDVPSNNLDRDFSWRESTGHAYLYKTFSLSGGGRALDGWSAVATVEGEYERIERPQLLSGSEAILDLETIRAPVGLRFFQANGFTLRMQATYIRQEGTFSQDIGSPIIDRDDRGWVADAAIDYQLPRRRGVITVGVMNIGDESINLVETDLFNPRVASARFAFAKLRLTF